MSATPVPVPDLMGELRRRGVQDVDDSTLTRALYSTDASLYRVVPQAVVRPRHRDELLAVLDVSRTLGVPLTMRGAGTSIAGNAVGTGLVVDTVKHLNQVLSIDPEARTAVVQPGAVHASLQRVAAPHGLRFGPDPSTHTRCTIGGMIGNNACGSRALGYGRTVDNIAGLDVAFGTGEVYSTSGGETHPSPVGSALGELAEQHLGHVRTEFGRFGRQVSGYSLEHLLPEKGRRVDRFLAGSEGTLGLVLEATMRLVEDDHRRLLVVLGYPSMVDAADAVPALLAAGQGRLVACEGLDARIVDLVRARGNAVPELPRGAGWLFAEMTGEDAAVVAGRVVAASGALAHRFVSDAGEAAALWRIREDGAGLAARSLSRPAYSGWEDAAVPPEHLGAWLRDFDGLLREYDLDGVPYGHFGDGCVHVRIDFPFAPGSAEDGTRGFRDFLTACATQLRQYGGSLSGEHGDGRARSELLPLMYDEESLRLFGAVEGDLRPRQRPQPRQHRRPGPARRRPASRAPPAADRPGPAPRARPGLARRRGAPLHRRRPVRRRSTTGVMCPSYLATRDEKDSTRGRSRVLQEALDGTLVRGLADPAVDDALDLCLSCKGCASDCPTGVDMATYKSEALHQKYARVAAGRAATTSWVGCRCGPALAAPLAPAVNRMMQVGPAGPAGAGDRGHRPAALDPDLRPEDAAALGRARSGTRPRTCGSGPTPSPTTSCPAAGLAAIKVLEAAGLSVRVIHEDACCGLTWVTTGQLDPGAHDHARTVETLAPYVASGVPVVGLEPSCLATLRGDAIELTDDPRAVEVAAGVLTFAELLTRLDWTPPDLSGVEIVAQPHCHQSAVLGWAADEKLLREAGAVVTRVAGCCGLAGNFGMEQGHYEVSVAVAETYLLPGDPRPRRRPSCSPTGCRAGSSSTTSPASRRCTWPNSSPLDSRRESPPPPTRHPGRAGGPAGPGRRRRGDGSMSEPLADALARVRELLLDPDTLVRGLGSGRRKGGQPAWRRVELRYVDLKAGRHLQVTAYDETQAHTSNHAVGEDALAAVEGLLDQPFGNWHVETTTQTHQLRVTKKLEALVHTTDRADAGRGRAGSRPGQGPAAGRGRPGLPRARAHRRPGPDEAEPTGEVPPGRGVPAPAGRGRSATPSRGGTCGAPPPRTRCGSSTWAAATPT